ncbi:MAG TPA: cupin domain-containing protein [Gaiellaceae bacterium]|nr:cupin domain-containing protein [Gaiellaceae bacterium]
MAVGWFVKNVRETQWYERGPRGKATILVEDESAQIGINLFVLGPGEPMAMYHWEADQEDYLVLSGEALLIVEDEERPLKQWDFVHTPPQAAHVLIGAGSGPAVILAVGARDHQRGDDWGGYPLSDVAARHDAASPVETNDAAVAYARFPAREPVAYRDGWLP